MCDLVMLGQSSWPGTCLLSETLLDKDENQSLCHNHWPSLMVSRRCLLSMRVLIAFLERCWYSLEITSTQKETEKLSVVRQSA